MVRIEAIPIVPDTEVLQEAVCQGRLVRVLIGDLVTAVVRGRTVLIVLDTEVQEVPGDLVVTEALVVLAEVVVIEVPEEEVIEVLEA